MVCSVVERPYVIDIESDRLKPKQSISKINTSGNKEEGRTCPENHINILASGF